MVAVFLRLLCDSFNRSLRMTCGLDTVQNGKGSRRRPDLHWAFAKPAAYIFARDREGAMAKKCKGGKKSR